MIRLPKSDIELFIDVLDDSIETLKKVDFEFKNNILKKEPPEPIDYSFYTGILDFLLFGAYQYRKPGSVKHQCINECNLIRFKRP